MGQLAVRNHPYLWCFGILAIVGLVVGLWITQQPASVAKSLTISPTVAKVPTHFTPEPTYFCNAPKQYGGLQNMVDTAGSPNSQNYQVITLALMTQDSPDKTTFTAMRSIYVAVLSHKAPSQSDINTVLKDEPCVA